MPRTPNIPLQVRAGKNYPSLFSIAQGLNAKGFKVRQTDTVVYTYQPDVVPGAVVFLPGLGVLSLDLRNDTGGVVDVSLFYVDAYGTEFLIDSDSIADADDGELKTSLAVGDPLAKIILRVTSGNINAGDGVHAVRYATQSIKDTFRVQDVRVGSNLQVPIEAPPGAALLGNASNILNLGSTAIDFTVFLVLEDGFEMELDSGTINAGATEQIIYTLINESVKAKIVFAAQPATGYILVQRVELFSSNNFEAEPAL